MKAIGLTGLARCGKDTVAGYLVGKHGLVQFDFYGNVLVPELQARKMEITKQNAGKVARELRKKFGLGILAKKLLEKIEQTDLQNCKGIVVTGLRDLKEVEIIRAKFPGMKIVLLSAPADKRFERRESTAPAEKEKFLERDKFDEKQAGMQEVFQLANFKLENNGTLEELFEKIDALLEKV